MNSGLKYLRIAVPALSLTACVSLSGIPHIVEIDRQGKVRLFRIGSGDTNAADLKKPIEESLSETPRTE